jgi:hypothetical protein
MSSDNRSVGQQVKSGFLIAGNLLFGFFVCALALGGLAVLQSPPQSNYSLRVVGSLAAVCLASAIMFLTAHRWGGAIAGFFFLPGVMRAFGALPGGSRYSSPLPPISRPEAGAFIIYCILLIALVWRFVGGPSGRITLSWVDRLALTVFVLGVFSYAVHPQSLVGLIGGFLALVVAWVKFRWQYAKLGRQGTVHRHSVPNS